MLITPPPLLWTMGGFPQKVNMSEKQEPQFTSCHPVLNVVTTM